MGSTMYQPAMVASTAKYGAAHASRRMRTPNAQTSTNTTKQYQYSRGSLATSMSTIYGALSLAVSSESTMATIFLRNPAHVNREAQARAAARRSSSFGRLRD